MTDARAETDALVAAAGELAPLLRDTAREAEMARRPLERVIDAVRESGLYSLMVPKRYGGCEQDLDTFFEVVLELSRADASMGWLTGFYIEHNLWVLNYPEHVVDMVIGNDNHVLAPAALSMGGGSAAKVDGGYRLSGRWQWGTGVIHATWVMAGGMVEDESGRPVPTFFLLPITDVEPIDTWYVTGMCATGSWDFVIDDVFVADDYVLPFQQFLDATSGIADRFSGPLYRTPLMPVLAFAAGLPILGAAKMALAEFSGQMREKIASGAHRAGAPLADVSGVVGETTLAIDTSEMLMRDVLADVMAKRNAATAAERVRWMSAVAYAVHTCKSAVSGLSEEMGASGGFLDNPVQRALRDISIAANHVVFAKTTRYGDLGRLALGQTDLVGRA